MYYECEAKTKRIKKKVVMLLPYSQEYNPIELNFGIVKRIFCRQKV